MKPTKEEAAHARQVAEWQFIECLRRAGNLVEPEFQVCKERKWRVDYLLNRERVRAPGRPTAVEIQGFGFGHVGRAGWLRDIEKCQAIAANGWLYMPFTREQIANGEALEALSKAGVRVESADRGRTFPVEDES